MKLKRGLWLLWQPFRFLFLIVIRLTEKSEPLLGQVQGDFLIRFWRDEV